MPISVQSWFGHELEIRGIDAVVYTRYIISLLKQDQVELDPGETDADHLWGRKYDLRRIRGKKSEKKKGQGVSEEDLKKSAAVECLMAISDEVRFFMSPGSLSINCTTMGMTNLSQLE